MAWLSGWDKRIKLTVDNTKIDTANLTWFPVTVFLTGSQAEEIFSELDADADYMKVAFTKADGETELYAECELFDHSESLGIYHVSRDGWVIAYDADTDFYMYYDNDHADNTTYIGTIDSVAGRNVWDGNFLAVFHMSEASGNVVDSTSNTHDGVATGSPSYSATGKIGSAVDFELDTPDYFTLSNAADLDGLSAITVELWEKTESHTSTMSPLCSGGTGYADGAWAILQYAGQAIRFRMNHDAPSNQEENAIADIELSDATWYHIVGSWADGEKLNIYRDGALKGQSTNTFTGMVGPDTATTIGRRGTHTEYFDGIIDEVRISNVKRVAGWINGTYNSLLDTLLAYGSEETEAVAANAIMFGMNF